MKLNDPYTDGEIVFTRSAKNITFTDAGNEPVRVYVLINGSDFCSFLVTPISGEILLHLKDILTSLEKILTSSVNLQGDVRISIPYVKITAGDISWQHQVICGKAGSLTISECPVLTSRPQKARTFTDGFERHVTKWYVPTGMVQIMCRLRFQTGVPQDIQLLYDAPGAGSTVIEDVDVSYNAIRNAADAAGYSSERITSYSIRTRYVIKEQPPARYGQWQHFIVCSGRHHQYMFRNHYGAVDTIYAVGQLSRSVDHETSTFLADKMEKEMSNDSVEKYEQASGYLVSNEEARFWAEFFRSKERYVVVSGELRPIVVDSVNMDVKDDEVNSVKFQWHYSELDTYDEPARSDEDDITVPGLTMYL